MCLLMFTYSVRDLYWDCLFYEFAKNVDKQLPTLSENMKQILIRLGIAEIKEVIYWKYRLREDIRTDILLATDFSVRTRAVYLSKCRSFDCYLLNLQLVTFTLR